MKMGNEADYLTYEAITIHFLVASSRFGVFDRAGTDVHRSVPAIGENKGKNGTMSTCQCFALLRAPREGTAPSLDGDGRVDKKAHIKALPKGIELDGHCVLQVPLTGQTRFLLLFFAPSSRRCNPTGRPVVRRGLIVLSYMDESFGMNAHRDTPYMAVCTATTRRKPGPSKDSKS